MAIYYSHRKELMQGEMQPTIGGTKSQRGRETKEECWETQEHLQNLSWSKGNGKMKLGEIPLGLAAEGGNLYKQETLFISPYLPSSAFCLHVII